VAGVGPALVQGADPQHRRGGARGIRGLTAADELLDQIPALRGPRTVEELPGGLTNLNLKVVNDSGRYVVRWFGGDASLLGIDRDAEHANTRAAATAGVAAGVVDYRPDLSMLVIEFVDGETFTNASFDRYGVLDRVAAACRTLHAGPHFVSDFDMFERQSQYLSIVREHGFPLFSRYEEYADKWAQVRKALRVRAGPTVPCNNDLLAGNFIDDGERLWLIDYEYSGNNDDCFELGNIGTECDLSPDQLEALVTAYDGRASRSRLARARLGSLCSEYGWALWGAIQAATSDLDYDFGEWGGSRFEKARATFDGPHFDRLLQDVCLDG
jgi:thiamine kinase-like enzyme